jgi:hypothetical protein
VTNAFISHSRYITIGGNDVGFSSIMETCILESTSSCESAASKAEAHANNTLPGNLHTLFTDIKTDAPNAQVVVLDYPRAPVKSVIA